MPNRKVVRSSVLHQLKTECMVSGITPPPIGAKLGVLASPARLNIYRGWIKAIFILVND